MASDLKLGRRRAPSTSLAARNGHTRTASKVPVQPNSSHTSDEFLKDFLNPSFDPAAFLNAKLPPLAAKGSQSQTSGAVPLSELSKQANTLLSQVNSQTTRLSTTLTQLTDEILRSGSRLAYEVELLRGETLSLAETMNESLKGDIELFIPGGLEAAKQAKTAAPEKDDEEDQETPVPAKSQGIDESNPKHVEQLKTLTLVRSRIDTVVKTFGDAMDFGFPPSEVSVSSGFLSVSAPEPGSEQQSSEEKGQQVLKNLREEISDLLNKSKDPVEGIEAAATRVEQLKELNTVWKGTAEEKGRNKFLESLAKMVEDKHRDLMKEKDAAARLNKAGSGAGAVSEEAKAPPGGFGLISQLQKLRSGL